MASAGNTNGSAISLDQLIALNDEMAALVRAGIPLEQGLEALGGDLPGTPGRLAQQLVSRMSSGESLTTILSDDDHTFPPVWRAVVEAGIRSGRLAAALESLSATARRVSDLRRIVGAGLVYPVVVVSLAYVLLLALLSHLVPVVLHAQSMLIGKDDPFLSFLTTLRETAMWWAIPLPLIAAIVFRFWWRRSGRAVWTWRGRSGFHRPARRGGFRGTIQLGRMATFSEVMALLIRSQVPLEDSLGLAAEASGDRTIVQVAGEVTERLRQGQRFKEREDLPAGLPPLLGWLLMSGDCQQDLAGALERSAAVYRARAARKAAWTAIYLPMWLTVFAGGAATLVCGIITFVPLLRLFYQLSAPLIY